MALNSMILGRNLDGENTAQVLNLAKLTIVSPASSANEPMRKQEYDTDISAITSRLTAVENSAAHLDNIYVDTTSPDLATAISAASFDAATDIWTFPGQVELTTGDLLKLNAATNQDSDRLWIVKSNPAGTVADFEPLGIDVDVIIQTYINNLKGNVGNAFDTLEKIEDQVGLTNDAVALRGRFQSVTVASWTDNGDGTWTASAVNPFNSPEVNVQVQKDEGLGSWSYHFPPEFDASATNSSISLSTASASLASSGFKLLLTAL